MTPLPIRPLLCVLLAGLAACAAPPPATAPETATEPATEPATATAPESAPATDAAPPEGRPLGARGGGPACRLPGPVRSEDPCSNDVDCAPVSPCHAKACVAVAKSQPRTPSTICTQNIQCDSADVNRCGCFEGRCALIPPS